MKALTLLANNRHTSIAGAVFVLSKIGSEIGAVRFPQHAAQFKATADIIESGAVAYGLLAAGDASASVSSREADTVFVRKSDLPAAAQPVKTSP